VSTAAPRGPSSAVPSGLKLWLAGARPRTLPAAIVPVLVGSAAAIGVSPSTGLSRSQELNGEYLTSGERWMTFALAMIVALALQVATNYANDYSDGKRGTDDPSKRVGPVRLVGQGLASPGAVKRAMLMSFAVALAAGSVIVLMIGWELIPVGIASVAAGWFYTGGSKPYGYAGFGEVFVFLFFGVVATVGATYVQIERITWLSVGSSVAVGSLATALLVVNNLRDIPGDTLVGKQTLAVRLGDASTRKLYAALMIVPFLLLPALAGLGGRPLAAAGFAAIILSTKPLIAVLSGASGRDLIAVLGATGRTQLAFGLLVAGGYAVVL